MQADRSLAARYKWRCPPDFPLRLEELVIKVNAGAPQPVQRYHRTEGSFRALDTEVRTLEDITNIVHSDTSKYYLHHLRGNYVQHSLLAHPVGNQ